MKVWSQTLTTADLHEAAAQVNAEFPGCEVFLDTPELHEGKRTRRIDRVSLRSATSTRYTNSGTSGADVWHGKQAASWTEWGWFLARVFERDAQARCGQYRDAQDFHAATGGRFIEQRTSRQRQVAALLYRERPGR